MTIARIKFSCFTFRYFFEEGGKGEEGETWVGWREEETISQIQRWEGGGEEGEGGEGGSVGVEGSFLSNRTNKPLYFFVERPCRTPHPP